MKRYAWTEQYDALIIGAGFAGSVIARELADAGRRVLLLERRDHIGGNMYDAHDEKGVLVHRYGPHLFHTNNRQVWDYLQPLTSWHSYEHRVLGRIQGQLVPIPFNFASIDRLFPSDMASTLKYKLQTWYPEQDRVSILDLKSNADRQLAWLGDFVFENVFVHYTAKQWGIPASQVDRSVLDRVPVVLGYDDRYFKDEIQMMPSDGFTALFKTLLAHPGIAVYTGVQTNGSLQLSDNGCIQLNGSPFAGQVVYTGAIDELLNYRYGALPYRSLTLHFENYDMTEYQTAGVVNYPNEYEYTRITEFKKLTGQNLSGTTTVLYEYPIAYTGKPDQDPYYPIESIANRALYERYHQDAMRFKNLHLCGRLAEYKYYNMDAVVERALSLARMLIEK